MSFLEKKEKERKEQPPKNYKCGLAWIFIIILFIISGTAFWWAPQVLPTLSKQKPESVESNEQLHHLMGEVRQVAVLRHDTDVLKSELSNVQKELRGYEQKPPSVSHVNIPLLLAFMDLKITIRLGLPYAIELARFKKQTSESTTTLEDYAEIGIPALPNLINQLKACIDEMPNLALQHLPQTLWEKIIDKVRSLIKVKKIEQEDTKTNDPWGLQPLLLLAKQGKIDCVLTQLSQKAIPESACLKTWKIHAEAYVKVEKRLGELMQMCFVNTQK
jgi:hypothetical protein